MDLVRKYIVHDSDEASPLLPMHVALVNEDGSEFGGGAAASAATVSKAGVVKKMSGVAPLAESATNADVIATVNDLISKAKSAGVMA